MVSTELLDRLHKLNRTDKLYVMQTLLNDLLAGEQASSIETVPAIEVKPDVIKQRIPNLRKGQGWVAEDFDAPLPDEFWLGESPQ
jgi:hypothetical protein